MKKMVVAILVLISSFSFGFSQLLEGDLLTDGRKIVKNINPVIVSPRYDGTITFNITVNNDGIVSAAKVIDDKTTIISTPARLDAEKLLFSLTFQAGNYFPKAHTGIYKITYKKKK